MYKVLIGTFTAAAVLTAGATFSANASNDASSSFEGNSVVEQTLGSSGLTKADIDALFDDLENGGE